MKHAILSETTHALRLERGDDILTTIQTFCAETGIANAAVSGIGSIEQATLAHYSMDTKQFTKRSFDEIHEITSLLGNIALVDGVPFPHLHVTIAGPDMQAHGGHLAAGQCSATLELIITSYPSHHTKSPDTGIGLTVWDFPDQPATRIA